jgi:hypothetical protein
LRVNNDVEQQHPNDDCCQPFHGIGQPLGLLEVSVVWVAQFHFVEDHEHQLAEQITSLQSAMLFAIAAVPEAPLETLPCM